MTEIEGEKWVLLKTILGEKVVFRVASIDKRNHRVKETVSGHRVNEAVAEGSVKCRSKLYDISPFVKDNPNWFFLFGDSPPLSCGLIICISFYAHGSSPSYTDTGTV